MAITISPLTVPTTSTVHTIPASDPKRAAAIAKIEARRSEANFPKTEDKLDPGNSPLIQQENQIVTFPEKSSSPDSEPKTEDPSKPDPQQEHIKQLAQREKAAWAELKKVKAEAEAAKKGSEGRLTKDEFIQTLKSDPTKLGLTYDDLGQMFLSQGQAVDPVVLKLQQEIADLKGTVAKVGTQAEEQTKAAYQQALKQIETDTRVMVAKDDRFEVTRAQGAEGAVVKLIELTFQEDGILMDLEDAATQVESHLEAEAIALYNKSKKLKGKLAPADQQAPQAQGTVPKQSSPIAQQRTKTLTPEMTQASNKPLSRRDRAVLAFQGKLKD